MKASIPIWNSFNVQSLPPVSINLRARSYDFNRIVRISDKKIPTFFFSFLSSETKVRNIWLIFKHTRFKRYKCSCLSSARLMKSRDIVISNSWQKIHLPVTTQEKTHARRKNLLFVGPTWGSFIRSVWFIDVFRCVLNEHPIRWTTFWPLSKGTGESPWFVWPFRDFNAEFSINFFLFKHPARKNQPAAYELLF